MHLTYITDPGHGWLLVTVAQLAEVNLDPGDFTRYSYRRGDIVALEEDCDMATFLRAYQDARGETPLIQAEHLGYDAPIRRWQGL
jgi:hypothetical protein